MVWIIENMVILPWIMTAMLRNMATMPLSWHDHDHVSTWSWYDHGMAAMFFQLRLLDQFDYRMFAQDLQHLGWQHLDGKISTKRSFANLASFENFYRKFIVSSSQRYWKQQQKQQFNSKLLGMEADFKKLFLLLFLCLQKKTCSINFLDINYKRSNDCRRRLMPSVVRHRKSWRFKDFQFSQKDGFI